MKDDLINSKKSLDIGIGSGYMTLAMKKVKLLIIIIIINNLKR